MTFINLFQDFRRIYAEFSHNPQGKLPSFGILKIDALADKLQAFCLNFLSNADEQRIDIS